MSILTKMKFIVRGKSVDFQNREGSSPSIPKTLKSTIASLIIYPFFVIDSQFVMFLIHFTLSQTDRNGNFFLMTRLVIYMIHVQMNMLEQESPFPI